MKSYRKELHFHFPTRRGLQNITEDVQKAVNESGLHHDYEVWLETLAPEKPYSQ